MKVGNSKVNVVRLESSLDFIYWLSKADDLLESWNDKSSNNTSEYHSEFNIQHNCWQITYIFHG